ncbi:MAG: type II toxin-antitoxin system RelE/ParE family toxin, partial [Bryobacteraceae bacterium]
SQSAPRFEIEAAIAMHLQFGPQLGRPRVDTLNGSRYANMKELRFSAAGDKSGGSEKRFYRELIRKADRRFDAHLARLKKKRK